MGQAVGVNDILYEMANRFVRSTVGFGMYMLGHLMRRRVETTVDEFREYQAGLRRRYAIAEDTPIVTFDDSVRASVQAYAATQSDVRFAYTSGSTSKPKKIAYPDVRIRNLIAGNVSVIARTMLKEKLSSESLFILSGLKDDDSLSTLILSDRGQRVKYTDGLLTPARYLRDPRLQGCLETYGPCATRLWLITLANSAIIYSTNPSTLALFLTEIYQDWTVATRMIREYLAEPEQFDEGVHVIRRRVAAPRWRSRFDAIDAAEAPIPVADYIPALRVYCCWDGGYVRPFLDQIESYLPTSDYRLVPMYSMSTEAVETLNYFDRDDVRFLPIAPDVYYEFLPEGAEDDPSQLIGAAALRPGHTYTMVVSDCYGLRRYQTEDVFVCKAIVRGAPDLRFLRRRGIEYSFTGEKLTGEQLTEAFAELREQIPRLRQFGIQLTCVPSWPGGAAVPGYRLVLAHPGRVVPGWLVDAGSDLAERFDVAVARINTEFAGKVESSRLAHTSAVVMPYNELAATLDTRTVDEDHVAKRTYDSQFKLLPLYSRLWEDSGLATVQAERGA